MAAFALGSRTCFGQGAGEGLRGWGASGGLRGAEDEAEAEAGARGEAGAHLLLLFEEASVVVLVGTEPGLGEGVSSTRL